MELYQINTKGEAVAKVGDCKDEREGVEYTIKRLIKAKGMAPKEAAFYLRKINLSRNQPIFFNSFKNSRLKKFGNIRLGQFVDKYEVSTLYAILEDIKGEK
jgi:hypothetical protein